MRSLIKKLVYGLIDMLTSGKGVPKTFEGNKVRMPTKYFRYFPVGYEKDNFNFINKKVRPGMTILDIGAHIGLMSTVFGKKVGPSGKVFAFEPTPTTVSTLKHTIAINDLANVSVEPFALSDQIGKLTFYISDNAVDNSNSLVNNHRVDRAEKGIEVDVYTVDNFVKDRNISKVDFMKIDVEGAELRVLKGAQKTLTNHKPTIILALHPDSIKNFNDNIGEIWDLLKNMGYKIQLENNEIDRTSFTSKKELFDVFLETH